MKSLVYNKTKTNIQDFRFVREQQKKKPSDFSDSFNTDEDLEEEGEE